MPFEYEAIRAQAQRTLVDFLNAELALASSFLRSASNSYQAGHITHYEEAKKGATKAADTVRRFLSTVIDGKVRNEIVGKLAELDRRIAAL